MILQLMLSVILIMLFIICWNDMFKLMFLNGTYFGWAVKANVLVFWPWAVALHELLVHSWNVSSVSLFKRFTLERWFGSPLCLICSRKRSSYYYFGYVIFLSTFRYFKNTYIDHFFHHLTLSWNSLSTKWFPLLYVLNCVKCTTNRHPSSLLIRFPVCFAFFLKAFKAFRKPSEAPERSVKIKI